MVPGLTAREKEFSCRDASLPPFFFGRRLDDLFLHSSYSWPLRSSFLSISLDLTLYRPEAGNYYSTVIWMTFAVGIAFQFPLVLILLVKIGILSVKSFATTVGCTCDPPDLSSLHNPRRRPVTLCILTVPLVLYELAIIAGAVIEKAKERREWEEWDESIQGPRPPKPKREKLDGFFT